MRRLGHYEADDDAHDEHDHGSDDDDVDDGNDEAGGNCAGVMDGEGDAAADDDYH